MKLSKDYFVEGQIIPKGSELKIVEKEIDKANKIKEGGGAGVQFSSDGLSISRSLSYNELESKSVIQDIVDLDLSMESYMSRKEISTKTKVNVDIRQFYRVEDIVEYISDTIDVEFLDKDQEKLERAIEQTNVDLSIDFYVDEMYGRGFSRFVLDIGDFIHCKLDSEYEWSVQIDTKPILDVIDDIIEESNLEQYDRYFNSNLYEKIASEYESNIEISIIVNDDIKNAYDSLDNDLMEKEVDKTPKISDNKDTTNKKETDMKDDTPNFKDWIIRNAVDEDYFRDFFEESYKYYAEDIREEFSSDEAKYVNRLHEEMVEHDIMSEIEIQFNVSAPVATNSIYNKEEAEEIYEEIEEWYEDEANFDEYLDEVMEVPEEFEDEYNAYSDYLKEEDPIPYRVGHADWSGTEGADILDEVREAINTAIKDIVDEIDSNIDYFIEKLVDEISDDFVGEYEAQMGADSLRNFIDNNPNAIDLDMVYEEVKNQDGRGSSLSGYDGE